MSAALQVLRPESRRPAAVPSPALTALAPLLVVCGLVFCVEGWVDVAAFYVPAHFGQWQWEFGALAQTYNEMPLATLGLVLVAVGLRASGTAGAWMRGLAVLMALIALVCLAGLLVFSLDLPIIIRAVRAAGVQAGDPRAAVASSGLKVGTVKVALFSAAYAAGYAAMAVILWRSRRVSDPVRA